MAAVKKSFRAETMVQTSVDDDPALLQVRQHAELMQEMQELKKLFTSQAQGVKQAVDPQEMSRKVMEEFRKELSEAAKLKTELDSIYECIARTKHEIATLHHTTGTNGEEMTRVTNELDAVILGTEGATERILSSAEFIDETANTLSARLKDQDADLANDIQEHVVHIFEACNFQDLTGQRITKVVSTLRFIEDRIVEMMDIWGGIDTFKDFEIHQREIKEGDAALLNGPSLEHDVDTVSQDDIDALFA